MPDTINLPFFAFLLRDRISLNAYVLGDNMPTPEDINRRLFILKREWNQYKPDYCLKPDFEEEMRAMCYDKKETLQSYLVKVLKFLSERYLFTQCGNMYVKENMEDEWMEFTRIFPPLMIEAAYFIDNEELLKDERSFLENVLTPIFGSSTLRRPYNRNFENYVREIGGLSDLHVHLSGISETDIIWWSQMGFSENWILSSFRNLENGNIRRQHEQISHLPLKFAIDGIRDTKDLFRDLVTKMDRYTNGNMIFHSASEFLHSTSEDIQPLVKGAYFYLKILTLMQKGRMCNIAVHNFHHMILILGYIHEMLVQQWSQKGFSQFQLITKNGLRSLQEEKKFKARFVQLGIDNKFKILKYIEGRFSPRIDPKENLAMVSNIKDGFDAFVNELKKVKKNIEEPKLRLIAHFIKKEDERESGFCRHANLRNETKKKAWSLFKLNQLLIYKRLKSISIVGLDAASNEMSAGPEVFAPVFRWLRKTWREKENLDLHFTFHAGEDFQHLLSGLRMMVEAVDFLEMEQGDRIGHGTAAGINPELWIDRLGGIASIAIGEWLDDLLMVYDLILNSNNIYPDLTQLIPRLHNEIEDCCVQVYGSNKTIPNLIKAWKYRAYDPNYFFYKKPYFYIPYMGDYDSVFHDIKKDLEAKKIYWEYHYCDIVKNRYNEIKQIDLRNDIFSVKNLEHIQNLVLNKIAYKKIAIEVLFTSNLAISFYKESKEHHFKRWIADSSDGKLMLPPIVIGSDDPGIFMTNIYIEYSRIIKYLEHHGFSYNERLKILNNIIQTSKFYSFNT